MNVEKIEIKIKKVKNRKEMKGKNENIAERENLPRWNGISKGHYEVWYITGNTEDIGFWIRYTINVSEDRYKDWAGIWLAVFKNGEKPIGICRKYPLGEFSWEKNHFLIKIGDENTLSNRKAKGKISVKNLRAEWELNFEPTGYVFKHLPEAAYYLPLETEVLSPNPELNLEGFIKIKDIETGVEIRNINVKGKGYQTHIWGKKHAFRWVWGHANILKNENGEPVEDSFFEGLTVIAKRGPLQIPPLSLFAIRYKGELFEFNNFSDIIYNSARWKFDDEKIEWELKSKKMDFRLLMRGKKENFIMATYDDPDGSNAFCHNSEIESAEIEFEIKGKKVKLFCDGTFHTEFGARTPLEYSPTKFLYE